MARVKVYKATLIGTPEIEVVTVTRVTGRAVRINGRTVQRLTGLSRMTLLESGLENQRVSDAGSVMRLGSW